MTYKIIGKYIKDLKFNIPNPKTFFLLSKNISNYKINIDIQSTQVKQNIIEVLTSLSLSPSEDNFEKIQTKIIHSTIVELDNKNTQKEENGKLKYQILIQFLQDVLLQQIKSFILIEKKALLVII